MASENANQVGTELADFIRSKFIPGDNVSREIGSEKTIIMKEKASLLIQTHLSSGRLAPFMKSGRRFKDRWIFELKNPIVVPVVREEESYDFFLKDVELQFGDSPIDIETLKSRLYEKEAWEKIKDFYNAIWAECAKYLPCFSLRLDIESIEYTINGKGKEGKLPFSLALWDSIYVFPKSGNRINIIEVIKRANEQLKAKSLFELCRDISPYNTPEKVCRFFGVTWIPYEKWKSSFSSARVDVFHGFDGDAAEDSKLALIFNGHQVTDKFPFRNAYGEVIQKVVRVQAGGGKAKVLIPLTSWMRDNYTRDSLFCIPHPKMQVIYNLDLLAENAKSENKKAVILTDSLEIAEANQRLSDQRFIWTSWICDEAAEQPFAQVDWGPLKDAGSLYYLISNHSDMTLADAYIKAYNLADYLEDNHDIELKFIQAPARFSKENVSLGVESEHVRAIDEFDEFERMYDDAVKALSSPIPPWYAKIAGAASAPQPVMAPSILERLSKRKDAVPYLLRPFITKGQISLLYAGTGLGKSALAYTLSASVVAGENPFQEYRESGVAIGDMKWWNGIKIDDGGLRKVLYLDFELGEARSDEHIKDYFLPYLPEDKAQREACLENFDVRHITQQIPDYSQKENHGAILKLVEESKKKGNGLLPAMIVFDTYTKAVGGTEDMDTWTRMKDLLDTLCSMGIAVLIVHQATKDGKSRGFADKDDNFTGILKMSRPNNASGTLDVPLQLKATKLSASCVKIDYGMFEVRFINGEKGEGGKWTVHKPAISSDEEFGIIVSSYKRASYKRDAIATMMGMGHDTCNRRMQAWRPKFGGKYKSMKLD